MSHDELDTLARRLHDEPAFRFLMIHSGLTWPDVDALLDLADADQREDFYALALALGSTANLLQLWRGTRRRLGLPP